MKSIIQIVLLCCVFVIIGCKKDDSGHLHNKMPCGGTANFKCPNTMYCELKENCGGYDLEGLCLPRPQSCPSSINPICGCNNQTYSNKCFANAAGITQKHPGECKN